MKRVFYFAHETSAHETGCFFAHERSAHETSFSKILRNDFFFLLTKPALTKRVLKNRVLPEIHETIFFWLTKRVLMKRL